MAKTLHLIVPGLLGPWPAGGEQGFPLPEAPALARLLAKGRQESGPKGLERTLLDLFAVAVSQGQDLPVAPLTLLADGGDPGRHWWLRADPVHLKADLHQIVLYDARVLGLNTAEAESLAAEFNQTFAPDGLTLTVPHPRRWYLRLKGQLRLQTHPLPEVTGRDINPRLPFGEDAGPWKTLLTEAQMLMHSASINLKREAKALPAANSVWFWGQGQLPEKATAPARGLYGHHPLLKGLARLAQQAIDPLPDNAGQWREAAEGEESALVVLHNAVRYPVLDDDPYTWSQAMTKLEQDWLAPLVEMLKGGELKSLTLYACDGRRFTVAAGDLKRFWRRVRPLPPYLIQEVS